MIKILIIKPFRIKNPDIICGRIANPTELPELLANPTELRPKGGWQKRTSPFSEKGLVCRIIIKYVVNVLDGYAALLVLLALPGRTEVLPRFSQPGGGIVPLPV